ncbi:hypothetical protein LCGC14_1577050 [marine sediment metagenome]|uniref:Uncharacterized protein n=1 Tax=marine sediment metagenome TaxID=412755 RepID=A0A0F9II47_9ZZZZ
MEDFLLLIEAPKQFHLRHLLYLTQFLERQIFIVDTLGARLDFRAALIVQFSQNLIRGNGHLFFLSVSQGAHRNARQLS